MYVYFLLIITSPRSREAGPETEYIWGASRKIEGRQIRKKEIRENWKLS